MNLSILSGDFPRQSGVTKRRANTRLLYSIFYSARLENQLKFIAKLYIPIEQSPRRVVPAFCGGTSINVSPEGGKLFRYPKAGIVMALEQSNVPCVSTFMAVAMPAFALVVFGK